MLINSDNHILEIKLPFVSHPWAIFVLWLSHIARYAPSPAGQNSHKREPNPSLLGLGRAQREYLKGNSSKAATPKP